MKIIKTAFYALASIASAAAIADDWSFRKFESGETIYKSGHYDMLIVGGRGVGFKTTQAMHDSAVAISIDGGKPIASQVDNVTEQLHYALIFKNSKELLPMVAKAKTIEISFNGCGNAFKSDPIDCFFTKNGEPYKVLWSFDKPLEASFDITSLTK